MAASSKTYFITIPEITQIPLVFYAKVDIRAYSFTQTEEYVFVDGVNQSDSYGTIEASDSKPLKFSFSGLMAEGGAGEDDFEGKVQYMAIMGHST